MLCVCSALLTKLLVDERQKLTRLLVNESLASLPMLTFFVQIIGALSLDCSVVLENNKNYTKIILVLVLKVRAHSGEHVSDDKQTLLLVKNFKYFSHKHMQKYAK